MLTLARLGNLKTLNYSPITSKERLNAESYYLSLIARELNFSDSKLQSQILATHPRYEYLVSEYGEPVINREASAVNPNSLAARLIKFNFYLKTESAEGARDEALVESFEAEIPMSVTAYTLLGIVAKEFGIPPRKCKLIWETGDWMLAPRVDDVDADWDSDSDGGAVEKDDEGSDKEDVGGRVMREVEIVPGTRVVGNWVEGMEAVVRVEIR